MISDKEKLEVEKSYTDEKYINEYSEKSFFDKALKVLKEAGIKVIYLGVLLYYVLQKPSVPLFVDLKLVLPKNLDKTQIFTLYGNEIITNTSSGMIPN